MGISTEKSHRKAGLKDLYRKVEPLLTCYWRRKANWQFPGHVMFCCVTVLLVVLLFGSLILFATGYTIEQAVPRVVYRQRFPSGAIDLKLCEPLPNVSDESTPLRTKHQNWMDHWMVLLKESTSFKGEYILNHQAASRKISIDDARKESKRRAMMCWVGKEPFHRDYKSFTAAFNAKPGYSIDAAYIFLRHNDGTEASYAPIYRQMVAYVDRKSTPPRHSVTFKEPNRGEEIIAFVVLENKTPGEPILESAELFKMEVQ